VTVVAHREVALDEVVEHGVDIKHVCLAVADELVLEHEPDLACGDVVLLGDVLTLTGDRAEDLGDDDALHTLLSKDIDDKGIRENVVGEVIALQGQQHVISPVCVGCRRSVQNS
jgi:hypothetical protein